jgi:DNA-binding CsgD family transcriptional regulator
MLASPSTLSDAQRPNLQSNLLRDSLQQATRAAAAPGQRSVSVAGVTKHQTAEKLSPYTSSAGFVLMDVSLSPISFNAEAAQILGYPNKIARPRRRDVFLTKIRSTLLRLQASGESPFVAEIQSGRRRYVCRAFLVESPMKDSAQAHIAVLLERGPSGLVRLSQVSHQLNLTRREQEALAYLLEGLSGKEIADRMNVSPNTVKAFLRLSMIKAGVSSRSAIVGKIMMAQP